MIEGKCVQDLHRWSTPIVVLPGLYRTCWECALSQINRGAVWVGEPDAWVNWPPAWENA